MDRTPWGTQSFENDDALEVLRHLAAPDGLRAAERLLHEVVAGGPPEQLPPGVVNRAVAAAAAVAIAAGDDHLLVPPDLREWREEVAPQPSGELMALALRALDAAEMTDWPTCVWDDDEHDDWRQTLEDIRYALQAARDPDD